ncbi:MAG: class I SAM-dependent methyltransferase [Planctomycetes bacterium]|nr:class I SAM-dependent methyltransferase [Planctomycetota bacterium]
MQTQIDTFFDSDLGNFHRRMEHIEAGVDPAAPVEHNRTYEQIAGGLGDLVSACRRLETALGADAALVRDTQARLQAATADWFNQSWIGERARSKPRGYPGDYLLLNTIYDRAPKSPGVGGYLDLWIMDLLLAHSVRARWQMLHAFLESELYQRREQNVAVLNVACGPCREYTVGIHNPGAANVKLTCLDNDQEALDYVAANVAPIARGVQEFGYARYNALRMKSPAATIRNFGRSDIIYSIGLCDYIDDEFLIAILAGWRESLSPGGALFVAFKDIIRYDPTPYQWLLDWHFFRRTEEDCRMLFKHAGYDMEALEMERDATGVIMSFISRAPAAAPHRVDAAEPFAAPHAWPADDLETAAGPDALEAL